MVGEVTLSPGDLLYLPRGFVHQAVATPSTATLANVQDGSLQVGSLHLTVSVGRQHTWRDLLEFGLAGALDAVSAERAEWRETLPTDLLNVAGVVHANDGGLETSAVALFKVEGAEGAGGEDEDEDGSDGEGGEERRRGSRLVVPR
jgi:hypothetical protein